MGCNYQSAIMLPLKYLPFQHWNSTVSSHEVPPFSFFTQFLGNKFTLLSECIIQSSIVRFLDFLILDFNHYIHFHANESLQKNNWHF